MRPYPKILTVFKRDPKADYKTLLEGEFADPVFAYLRNNLWEFEEKIDGMNIRVIWDGSGGLSFAGRQEKSKIPPFLGDALEKIFYPKVDIFRTLFDGVKVCLYGEGYGAKIQQRGKLYRSDQGFVLFDVWINGWWLKRDDVHSIAGNLGMECAPVVGVGTLYEMIALVKTGIKSRWGDFDAEGIVARPQVELYDRSGTRVITKVKMRDFRS